MRRSPVASNARASSGGILARQFVGDVIHAVHHHREIAALGTKNVGDFAIEMPGVQRDRGDRRVIVVSGSMRGQLGEINVAVAAMWRLGSSMMNVARGSGSGQPLGAATSCAKNATAARRQTIAQNENVMEEFVGAERR